MLFSDFKEQVRRQLEEPTEGVWSDASILYWANEAAKDIARRVKLETDEQYATAVVGQSSYPLPDYTLELRAVLYDGLRLTRERFEDYLDLTDTDNGTPVYYSVEGDNLYLRPAPDENGEIRFFRYAFPDPMTADTDELPFESLYVTALEYSVLRRAFEQVGDSNLVGYYAQMYENEVGKAITQESIERQVDKTYKAPKEVW